MEPKECGYDATFISEPHEFLCCSICHLVLRDPVLIITCGHKFCQPCFNRLRERVGTAELQCPIDREVIDMSKVCEDLGLRRTIGCLVVKCGSHQMGCVWEGQLSDLAGHQEQCKFRTGEEDEDEQPDVSGLMATMKELQVRMDRCEESAMNKEKELAHMKMRWESEVDELRQEKNDLQKVVDDLMQRNEELREKFDSLEILNGPAQLSEREHAWIKAIIEKHYAAKWIPNVDHEMNENPIEEAAKQLLGNKNKKLFEIYCGPVDKVVISADHLDFDKYHNIVAMPSVLVSRGSKVYFEVSCTDIWEGGQCSLGWTTHSEFQPLGEDVFPSFFDTPGVKWYSLNCQKCYENGNNVSLYGNKGKRYFGHLNSPLTECVIGIAADMTNPGQLLYSFNGDWEQPMGVAFKNLLKSAQYFPVFYGHNMTLVVNVGNENFKHAPPDASFKKLNTLF